MSGRVVKLENSIAAKLLWHAPTVSRKVQVRAFISSDRRQTERCQMFANQGRHFPQDGMPIARYD